MIDDKDGMARVEAVLFLAKEPIPSRKLALLADVEDGARARALVRRLNERYRRVGSAFCAVEVAGGFQLRAAPEFAPWLLRLSEAPVESRPTGSAMETLAIVAYEQPILRAKIEAIRGVHCGDVLRQLLEQDLIKIVGRSEELGRPFLYGTTKRFLTAFGLTRIEDLPRRNGEWTTAADVKKEVAKTLAADAKKSAERLGDASNVEKRNDANA
ncbi:MAG: SMC-Scp complex subunit ScpB [Thermoguttaceae bacterium]|nr:SMC-Scp complex subunit ScpB [Thermoguttaceae bacterium]